MLVIRRHQEQRYTTVFNPKTGFFARIEDAGRAEPSWSMSGPEILDISITGSCRNHCSRCYRNSLPGGFHIAFSNYVSIMRNARSVGVHQVALGGGNPNEHPEFCRILQITRDGFDIVPSYSTNGSGLNWQVLVASREFCGSVAVSYYPPKDRFLDALSMLAKYGVRTNIHFVLDAHSVETAIDILQKRPDYLQNTNAIVFLNYKPAGRGGDSANLLARSSRLETFFEVLDRNNLPCKIGFDSCCVSGIVAHTKIRSPLFDACEASRFSMFISEKLLMYPCSFMEGYTDGVPFVGDNLLETWTNHTTFQQVRQKLLNPDCPQCAFVSTCYGGCPIFPSINLCEKYSPKRAKESLSAPCTQ